MAEAAEGGNDADAEWEKVVTETGPLNMEDAYAVLRLGHEHWGKLEDVKSAYRRLSIRWHPDKNRSSPDDTARATAVFTRIAAAYNTLTTNNFDYERWRGGFTVPQLQTLEDVLLLAMKGADPFVIDSMLRSRGDYRPHAQFGIDLGVPWSAGTQEMPSWEVVGAKYSRTRAIEPSGPSRAGEIAWLGDDSSLPEAQRAGGSAARPWERVGGSGWEGAPPEADRYEPVGTRPELAAGAPGAAAAAEEYNDRGTGYFAKGKHREAVECFSEALRLRPGVPAFLGNRAAAALKLRRWRDAAADCRAAVEADPGYARGWLRLGQAQLGAGEEAGQGGRAALEEARGAFGRATELEPASQAAKNGARAAGIAIAAEFSDDDD